MQTHQKKILLSWTAPEFTRHEKSPAWFITLGVIIGLFFIAALLMQNYFFALLVLLAGGLIYIHALKHPRTLTFSLTEEGFKVGDRLFPLQELKSFWVFEDQEILILSIETTKALYPQLHIPLGNQKPEAIRQEIIKLLPEKEQKESLIDLFARKIKF